MRKLALSLIPVLFSIAFSTLLRAQSGVHFNLFTQPTVSFLLNSDDNEALEEGGRWSNGFGLNVGFDLKAHYGLETGIMFSQGGGSYQGVVTLADQTLKSFDAKIQFSQVKIPLVFRVNTEPFKRTHFHGFMGAQVSILTAARQELNGQPVSTTNFSAFATDTVGSLPVSAQDLYRRSTIDVVFGLGVDVRLWRTLYFVSALRFDYALTDLELKDFSYKDASGAAQKPYLAANGGADRHTTAPVSVGLQAGVSYFIPFKKAKGDS